MSDSAGFHVILRTKLGNELAVASPSTVGLVARITSVIFPLPDAVPDDQARYHQDRCRQR